jgi:nitrate/TMAO reductase-like tetraheme cytochrome c subunit
VRLAEIRRAIFGIFLVIGFAFLILVFSIQVTSTPFFCGLCHYMKPYYKSWQTSTHKEVACVECHIPPGITSEFKKKFEALAMVARYITGTYGTNPWAEIEDESCLRCHEKRLLEGKEIFKGVLFDHEPHLTELRRKKRLRCTSCHSQIVQGAHITVTTSTCFLCHFKDQPVGEGTGKCTLCHRIPEKIVKKGLIEFNHGDVIRFRMDCSLCHAHTIKGNGEVPRDRCLTCHNRPDRLALYDETEMLHIAHVTEHKVECISCHIEIRHGVQEEIEIVETGCNVCHEKGHSLQRDLYMGIGGKGVSPIPSPMFDAGVRCEGCHILAEEALGVSYKRAGSISCMNCHGANYNSIYESWVRGIRSRTELVKSALRKAKGEIRNKKLLEDAEYNLLFVEKGVGIHNPQYAIALLDWSLNKINEALKREGKAVIGTSLPQLSKIECMRCHIGIENQTGEIFGTHFKHEVHLRNRISCKKCHIPHDGKPVSPLKISKSGCSSCHHRNKNCEICHGSGPEEPIEIKEGSFDHQLHVKEVEITCDSCHNIKVSTLSVKRDFCKSCH